MEPAGSIPVKKRAVGVLVLAETISVLGTRMTYLALPWFVLVTTGSPAKMSLVLAAEILPMAILGVPSGAVVQRLGSRTTMLVADLARAPILAAIPVLHAAGALTFELLLGIVAALGCFTAPYFASQRTVLRSSSEKTRGGWHRRTAQSRAAARWRRCSGLRSPAPSFRSSGQRTCSTSTRPRTSSRSCSCCSSYRAERPWRRQCGTASWPGFASCARTSSSLRWLRPRWPSGS